MRLALRLIAATLVSVAILWLSFRSLDPALVWASIRAVRPEALALYTLALLGTQVARAARWGLLVAPFAPLSRNQMWRVSNVGNMLIMLLPLRLGELGRPYLMKRLCGAPLSQGVGAAAIERVLDGLLVTLLFFATTACQGGARTVGPLLWTGAQIALVIFLGASVALALIASFRAQATLLIDATLGRVAPALSQRILGMLVAFIDGLRALPSAGAALGVVAWTLAYWASNALGMLALMRGFGLDVPTLAGFTVVCVLVIGVMIPAGPGLLGTYQAAIMAGLAIYGVERSTAAGISVVAYLINLGVIVGCAAPYLSRGQLGLSLVQSERI